MCERNAYPSDGSDEEWAFVAPYLTWMREVAPQREDPLREEFNALRYLVRGGVPWRMLPNDLLPWHAVYEQTQRWRKAGVVAAMVHDLGAKRREGSKMHITVDTLGQLLALVVTAADEQDRAQVAHLAQAVQQATGQTVELAFVDQGYTGAEAEQAAAETGIRLEVVKLPDATKGCVLLPRR